MGLAALAANTTGSRNTALGYQSLQTNTTASENIALGYQSLQFNTIGTQNTALGYQALQANINGNGNIAIGSEALTANINGNGNTAIGDLSLNTNTSGTYNIALGYQTLQFNTTGTQNTALGFQAGYNIETGSNNTCIGYNSTASSATAINEITLGDVNITSLRCHTGSITTFSDSRDKKDIEPLNAGLDFVEKLKPVYFNWNMRDGGKVGIPDTGFLAQDLKQVQIDTGITIPGLVYESNPERLEASYGKLLPVLVKAIQDLKKEVDELKAFKENSQKFP